jgi:hypothetical protein
MNVVLGLNDLDRTQFLQNTGELLGAPAGPSGYNGSEVKKVMESDTADSS